MHDNCGEYEGYEQAESDQGPSLKNILWVEVEEGWWDRCDDALRGNQKGARVSTAVTHRQRVAKGDVRGSGSRHTMEFDTECT